MIFDDLNDDNFLMYAMKEYNDIQCTDIEEFYDDLKKIKYIKRLFNIYKNNGQLKERLILNHLIVFYNVFPLQSGTRILFYKIERDFWPMLKTFLVFLDRMPETIDSIRGEMIFDDLNEGNFLMYSMKEYNNIQCVDIEEFYDDLKKIKYIKRLFNIYLNDGQLKERLILNHLIVFYNVFPIQAGTRILFYKIEEQFWPMLKTFLIFLDRMPDKIESIRGKTILATDIKLDDGIVTRLRTIKV